MPNIISSAIVNTPPPDALADLLNKRNKVHHFDEDTDENMIPIFTHDVTGKPRNNKRLLNRRNWCSIRQYNPDLTPPPTPEEPSYDGSPSPPEGRGGLFRRFSRSGGPTYRAEAPSDRPPISNANFFSRRPSMSRSSTDARRSTDSARPGMITRTLSLTRNDFMPSLFRRNSSKKRRDSGGINGYGSESDDYDDAYYDQHQPRSGLRGGGGDDDDIDSDGHLPSPPKPLGRDAKYHNAQASTSISGAVASTPVRREFHRTPTGLSQKQLKRGNHTINLEGGLDICLNVEVNCKDPAGITMPYRLLVPMLWYDEEGGPEEAAKNMDNRMRKWKLFSKKGKGFGRWHEHKSEQEMVENKKVNARGL
jgi:hypothetical protein